MRMEQEELDEVLKNKDLSVNQGNPLPAFAEAVKKNKFNAQCTEYNGVTYDSKKEANYASDLNLRIKAGDLSFWLRQVSFALPGGVKYRADFVEFTQVANTPLYEVRVVDVKGRDTQASKNKRKQVKALYNVEVELE